MVEEYESFGDHRTGTSADDRTRAWFSDALRARGAVVQSHAYDFDRYDARSRVDIDGREVGSLPLAYSGLGALDVDAPFVAEVDPGRALGTHLDEVLGAARASGARAAVLATRHVDGHLVAMNRPASPGAGPPAVLVAGAETGSLLAGAVRLGLDARLVPGRSATVVARWGDDDAPVVVTTPLTGWFACAGERGTGIALALELAATLAPDLPVLVVGTTGHELEHLGARSFLAGHRLTPRG